MAADLITAGNNLKGKCYDMVREYFDDLGVQWLDDRVADAWLGLLKGVSDGINAMVASVIEDRIVEHTAQRLEYLQLREKLADLTGQHSRFCPDCVADTDDAIAREAAGAYLSSTVAVDATCYFCKAEAEAVLCSDLLGEHDVCQACGEYEIARMRRRIKPLGLQALRERLEVDGLELAGPDSGGEYRVKPFDDRTQ